MIDLDRLKSTLMTSGLQQKDNALFQVISQLIDALRQFVISINGSSGSTGGSGSVAGIVGRTYLTKNDETGLLPNSVQLLAGTGITFDDSIPNRRTINGSSSSGSEWSVLTNGDLTFPELIFVGGDVIMIHTP